MTSAASRSIRVLLLCESLAVTGGVERFVCQLANDLSTRGFDVAIGNVDARRGEAAYPVAPAVRVVAGAAGEAIADAGGRAWRLLRTQWRAARSLVRVAAVEAPDVIVLNGVVLACAFLLLNRRLAARCICCDHNHFGARSRPWRWLRARLYPSAAAVVSLTEADAPRFRALNERTVVIANASTLTADRPAAPLAPVVLAVGRHQAQKGFDLLLAAWPAVVAACPAARLRIVGDGPLRAALMQQAGQLAISASVEWLPPTAGIETLYREAAIFVLSSRYEGMPLALLEAQALGVPAVAFDCPTGPREVVTDATGVVVPAGDAAALGRAIVGLLDDPDRRAAMGRAAIARSREHFGLGRHLDAWAGLVTQVARGMRAAPTGAVRE